MGGGKNKQSELKHLMHTMSDLVIFVPVLMIDSSGSSSRLTAWVTLHDAGELHFFKTHHCKSCSAKHDALVRMHQVKWILK